MGVALIVKKLKSAIAKLKNQIAIGIKNARKYIIALIDCENKLTSIEAAVQPPLKSVTPPPVQLNLMDFLVPTYSEEQIKKAFVEVGGCLQKYWKPEMLRLIPELIGLEVRPSDPWDWMSQFTPIQEMEKLGWSDRLICYCVSASKIL
jgi:hypothetical protein